jgi:hypothetical protein
MKSQQWIESRRAMRPCVAFIAPGGDPRSKAQPRSAAAIRRDGKPRAGPLVAIAHEQLRGRARTHIPRREFVGRSVRHRTCVGPARGRLNQHPQQKSLDPEQRRGVKRKHEFGEPHLARHIHGKAIRIPSPALGMRSAAKSLQQSPRRHGFSCYGKQAQPPCGGS